MSNIVAIVGRPNVGKSTLFNRLTDSRKAIVDEVAGVTRDRHYGHAEWNGYEFSIIDTGGYVKGSDDIFEDEIRKQVTLAVDEANVLVFVVDVETGVTHYDEEVAKMLRKTKKKVFVVSNKVDNGQRLAMSSEFYALGLGDVYSVSAINGSGTGELLDDLVKCFEEKTIEKDELLPRFAIVGRPNVGKSSLLNSLLGNTRSIVTDIAGTTRDSINTRYNLYGKDIILIDTAGIRKKSKVHEDLEFFSVMRSIKAIEDADVCLLMIDAKSGIEAQDMSIFQVIQNNRRGIVILVNKWDLVEDKGPNSVKEYEKTIREHIAPFVDVPIVFISVLEKQRIMKAVEVGMEVYENRIKRISTSELNEVMLAAIEAYPPPAIKGRYVKIKHVQQLHTHSPSFIFFCNLPQYVNESYKRYLENKLRDHFNFSGVPIQIFMRKK